MDLAQADPGLVMPSLLGAPIHVPMGFMMPTIPPVPPLFGAGDFAMNSMPILVGELCVHNPLANRSFITFHFVSEYVLLTFSLRYTRCPAPPCATISLYHRSNDLWTQSSSRASGFGPPHFCGEEYNTTDHEQLGSM